MKRILFVDDERPVLDALRALLRHHRHKWDMVFVDGGRAAMQELERGNFDVIVSDMRMPDIDGATLLRHVQERHPSVVRLVHSGYAELEAALRTIPVAHQFLIKPCGAEVLENVVERTCALQALILDPAVREYVGGLQRLPSLPQAYLQLTGVLADENSGVEDVARVIEGDSSMCAKVLQLVNSSFIGVGRELTNIELAIAYLGTNMVKNLTLVVHVFSTSGLNPAHADVLTRMQRHSMLVSAIARSMTADQKRLSEDAFIAGILHDIGKLILASERPDAFGRIVSMALDTQRPLFEVEQQELGVTHAELGGYLLGIWGLPYPIVEAVANHHCPWRVDQQGGLDVLSAVYVADLLAHEQEALRGGHDAAVPIDLDYLERIGVMHRLPAWRELAAAIAIVTGVEPDQRAA